MVTRVFVGTAWSDGGVSNAVEQQVQGLWREVPGAASESVRQRVRDGVMAQWRADALAETGAGVVAC
jgi:hypothetical protein